MLAEPTIRTISRSRAFDVRRRRRRRVLGRACCHAVGLLIGQCGCCCRLPRSHATPVDRDSSRCRLASRENGRNLSHALNPGRVRSAPAALPWPCHSSLESEGPARPARMDFTQASNFSRAQQRGPALGEARSDGVDSNSPAYLRASFPTICPFLFF